MGVEIERKFLIKKQPKGVITKRELMTQVYLSHSPVVRIRVVSDLFGTTSKGFITVKGKNDGITRSEYEYEIPAEDAMDLVEGKPAIIKQRTTYRYDRKNFEVDSFLGNLSGLMVCEVELNSENEEFEKPDWLGEEVSDDARYYNSNLIKMTYFEGVLIHS